MDLNKKVVSYKELKRNNYVECDFCDKEFKNRYDSIVHNAAHIIIPLWAQSFHKCEICNVYNMSLEAYENHKTTHHINVNKTTIKGARLTENEIHIECKKTFKRKRNVDKFNVKVKKEIDNEIEIEVKNDIEREIEIEVENDVEREIESNNDIEVKNEIEREIESNNDIEIEVKNEIEREIEIESNNDVEIEVKNEIEMRMNNKESIRNRIKFEDDEGQIMNDLLNECRVSMNLYDPPWAFGGHNKYTPIDTMVNIDKPKDQLFPTSISYSCLIKPGIYSCKYCSSSYPNRFSLIQHETTHIKIQPKCMSVLCLQCDRYLVRGADAMHRHKEKFHKNGRAVMSNDSQICKRCHLRYRKHTRHVKNYHPYNCHRCGIEFHDAKQYSDHMERQKYHNRHLIDIYKRNVNNSDQIVVHCKQNVNQTCEDGYSTKILRVCDLCISFLKKKTNLKYYFVGETSDKLGVRYPCDNCGRKNFVLKIVKRLHKIQHYHRDNKNKMTNEDRLKSIRHRLKKLNLLNKYSVV